MLVATLIVICGHGVQGYPSGYDPAVPITHSVWAPAGTTFVQGVNALLNVVYTFIGHALIPSFVGDMERPQDFPKALAVSMAAEFALFTITGAVVYHYTGTEYATAPAYGSLRERYGKVAAGFVLPTIISAFHLSSLPFPLVFGSRFLVIYIERQRAGNIELAKLIPRPFSSAVVGILYSLVTSRAIFFQIFREGSRHRTGHTFLGWGVWIAIVFGGWVISFIIGEAIPFFSDMLSLISSLFDSWFGYIMWACAWWQMSHGKRGGFRGITETIANARKCPLCPSSRPLQSSLRSMPRFTVILITGFFFFGAGTYASVQSVSFSRDVSILLCPSFLPLILFFSPSPTTATCIQIIDSCKWRMTGRFCGTSARHSLSLLTQFLFSRCGTTDHKGAVKTPFTRASTGFVLDP